MRDKVTNEMREINILKGCKPSENHTQRSNSMDFGFENIMDFAINIDKLHMANLVGKGMDEIIKFKIFLFLPSEKGEAKEIREECSTN